MTENRGRLARRLGRILLVLPYAIRNPGVTLDELGRRFRVDKKELIRDLNLLWCCGLPEYTPLELIDVDIEGDHVYVHMADYFDRPLRLTPHEALVLYTGASAIASLPEMKEANALRRALEKLGRTLGANNAGGAPEVDVKLHAGRPDHLGTLQRAVEEGKQVRMEYFSAARGELGSRVVEPWGLVAALGHWYLVAWDHAHRDERMFRMDRVKSVEMTDAPSTQPSNFRPDKYKGAFHGGDEGRRLKLEISPDAARWFEDYYPVRSSRRLDDGWQAVELTSSGERWAAALVLRLGRDVRSVEPEAAIEEAKRLAQRIAARHS